MRVIELYICDRIPLQDVQLTNFGTRLVFLDNVLKGRITGRDKKLADQLFMGQVITRSQRKESYSKLKNALRRNLTRDEETNYGYGKDINDPNYVNEDGYT